MSFSEKVAVASKGLGIIIALVISPLTHATTIYDESVLGDFNAGQFFTLNDTRNVFVGAQAMGADPVDGFRFVIQSGQQATINFSSAFSNLGVNEAQAWVWDLKLLSSAAGSCIPDPASVYSCALPPETLQNVTSQVFRSEAGYAVPAFPIGVDFDQVTLSAGTYLLTDNFSFGRIGDGGKLTGLFSYSIDIEQTAVPVPAAVWLFGSGLLGFTGLARQRKRVSIASR